MTETQTPLPNLTITAQTMFTVDLDDPDHGWRVDFFFDGFPAGRADDVQAKLVAHWRMTPEVAKAVVTDLWNQATAEDGCGFAEVLLCDEPDEIEDEDPEPPTYDEQLWRATPPRPGPLQRWQDNRDRWS